MTMESLTNFAKKAGTGFGSSGGSDNLRTILTELQGLKRNSVAGFGSGASAAISGLSAARGDTLLSVIVSGSSILDKDITGSASFVNDRLKIIDTSTSSTTLDTLWFSKAGG